MSVATIRWLFLIAGIYDLIIGLVFLLRGPQLFDWAGVTHPNHWGYIHFGSLMLIIFGMMFLKVASSPYANRNLIPYGMMLKISYIGIIAFYWVQTGVPRLFQPFVIVDLVMLVLFVLAYLRLALAGTE